METEKKALLVVSFGTSYTEAIENCIHPVEKAAAQVAEGFDLYRAFTSNMVIRKLKDTQGLVVWTPGQALEELTLRGYQEIAVQPTHILAGVEYHELKQEVMDFQSRHAEIRILLGQPLLFENKDYVAAAKALGHWMPETGEHEVVLLMGHGTEHVSNSSYFELQYYLDRLPTKAVYVANVEAPPVLEDVMQKFKEEKIQKIYLMPFMLVAGDHAHNDMTGTSENSWSNQLQKQGFTIEVLMKGLGESSDFCRLYAEKTALMLRKE